MAVITRELRAAGDEQDARAVHRCMA
jgi:hypothetical protein